jgi:hypothetical protein
MPRRFSRRNSAERVDVLSLDDDELLVLLWQLNYACYGGHTEDALKSGRVSQERYAQWAALMKRTLGEYERRVRDEGLSPVSPDGQFSTVLRAAPIELINRTNALLYLAQLAAQPDVYTLVTGLPFSHHHEAYIDIVRWFVDELKVDLRLFPAEVVDLKGTGKLAKIEKAAEEGLRVKTPAGLGRYVDIASFLRRLGLDFYT